MVEYIMIGIFVVVVLSIVILYCINSKKIKKNREQEEKIAQAQKEKEAKAKAVKTDETKDNVVIDSKIIKVTPIVEALDEYEKESDDINIEVASTNDKTKTEGVKTNLEGVKSNIEGIKSYLEREQERQGTRLKLDRSDFRSELQRNNMTDIQNEMISSQYNEIGKEGPSKSQIDETNAEIEKESETSSDDENTSEIAKEFKKLSPRMKAMMIDDIWNKKG